MSRVQLRITCALACLALAAPLYAQGVTLRYHWNRGDALTYRMLILTTSQVSGMAGPRRPADAAADHDADAQDRRRGRRRPTAPQR